MSVLSKWLEDGEIKPIVQHVYDFTTDGAMAIFEEQMGGRVRGKLVLRIIPDNDDKDTTSEAESSSSATTAKPTKDKDKESEGIKEGHTDSVQGDGDDKDKE